MSRIASILALLAMSCARPPSAVHPRPAPPPTAAKHEVSEPAPATVSPSNVTATWTTPEAAVCSKDQKRPLSFEDAPVYTAKVDRQGVFGARLYVSNPASCERKVTVTASFTPPATTATRTLERTARVPPGGAFVELQESADALERANVVPGRYAITFSVTDDDGKPVGKALSGNPFKFGRDEVTIQSPPKVPRRISVASDLLIDIPVRNAGDTASRITPLVVFTRPGGTTGIEHYEPPLLVVPGSLNYTVKLPSKVRDAKGIGPGHWLMTVTLFDAAGERVNSYAGLPLSIGTVDVRLSRPDVPRAIKRRAPLRLTLNFEHRGDARDRINAIVALTPAGSGTSHEFPFWVEVAPGKTNFDAVVTPEARTAESIGTGSFLVTTTAFTSSGERIQSFSGQPLDISD